MQCETRLWFGVTNEEMKNAKNTTEGDLLLVETDAFPVKGAEAASVRYAFSGDDAGKLFYKSMRGLVASKIGSGLYYEISGLAPIGGWPEVEKKVAKYEGLTDDEKEIMRKADEITAKCKAMKAARKADKKIEEMPPAESGESDSIKKTATQEKKDRKAAKAARLAAEESEFKGGMSAKTKALNDLAREIGPSWTAEKVSAEE